MRTLFTLIFSGIILIHLPSAHASTMKEKNQSKEHCGYTIESDLDISLEEISITNKQGKNLRVDNRDNVFVDGEKLTLNASERQDFGAYRSEIQNTAKQVEVITANSLGLAEKAISHVMHAMFNIDEVEASKAKIATLTETIIDETFYDAQGNFHFKITADNNETGSSLNMAPSDAFGDLIGDTVGDIIGNAFSNHKDSERSFFEVIGDIEKATSKVEAYTDEHGQVIEEQALKLCDNLAKIDGIEQKLAKHHPSMQSWDIISKQSQIIPKDKRLK